jgi:thiamine-phosphate pyrophosphorylase
MNNQQRTIQGGLYLVIDPAKGLDKVLPAVQQAISGGVDIIQVWNHWEPGQDKLLFIQALVQEAHAHNVPVLINEEWEWLKETKLDGVHFDEAVVLEPIQAAVGRPFLAGITCGNDLQKVQKAIAHQFDYISFCAMFPSASANSCELVSPETVQAARRLTAIPLFVSGGITPQNVQQLTHTGIDGVAVISGIMSAKDPRAKARQYKEAIQTNKQHSV